MPAVKTGVTFVLGAMCGALITRGLQRCHHHEALLRWSSARQILEKNIIALIPEGKGDEAAAATVRVANYVGPMFEMFE